MSLTGQGATWGKVYTGYKNAKARSQNYFENNPNGGLFGGAKAFFTPNRTAAGDALYNSPTSVDLAYDRANLAYEQIKNRPRQEDSNPFNDYMDAANRSQQKKFGGQWNNGQYFNNVQDVANNVMAQGTDAYNRQAKQIQNAYNAGLLSYEEQVAALNNARTNIQNQMKNLTRGYQRSLQGLADTRDDTISSQRMYFQNVSPEAYQSQQGVYEGKTRKNYDEGVADVKEQYRQNQIAQQQYLNQLASQQSALGRARQQIEETKAQQLQEAQQNLTGTADTLRNQGLDYGVQNVLPNFAPPSAPSFRNYDIGKYLSSFNEQAIGQGLKGGSMDPQVQGARMRAAIEQDPEMTDEEKINQLAVLNFLYGMQ